jgi:hypothetical protein
MQIRQFRAVPVATPAQHRFCVRFSARSAGLILSFLFIGITLSIPSFGRVETYCPVEHTANSGDHLLITGKFTHPRIWIDRWNTTQFKFNGTDIFHDVFFSRNTSQVVLVGPNFDDTTIPWLRDDFRYTLNGFPARLLFPSRHEGSSAYYAYVTPLGNQPVPQLLNSITFAVYAGSTTVSGHPNITMHEPLGEWVLTKRAAIVGSLGSMIMFAAKNNYVLAQYIAYHVKVGFDTFLCYLNQPWDQSWLDDHQNVTSLLRVFPPNHRHINIIFISYGVSYDDHRGGTRSAQVAAQNHAWNFFPELDWIFTHDIDEFIVPHQHSQVTDYLETVPRHVAGLIVETSWFGCPVGEPVWDGQTFLEILIARENATSGSGRAKPAVRPGKITHVHVHWIHDSRYAVVDVPPSMWLINHYFAVGRPRHCPAAGHNQTIDDRAKLLWGPKPNQKLLSWSI